MKSIALNKLVPSTENVRLVNPGKASDKELIASIEAIGLLQNLTVSAASNGRTYLSAFGPIQKTYATRYNKPWLATIRGH